MNDKEKKAFEQCMKQIKRLLIEEKQTKAKLEKIQKTKLELDNFDSLDFKDLLTPSNSFNN